MMDVFLSASVPLPTRHARYFDTADVLAIREAIKSLVEVVLPQGRITFGGHPAITPLIALFVQEANLDRDRLTIFQSRLFDDVFPPELSKYCDVRLVDAVDNDKAASLLAMRRAMINSREFDAAVLIGGMEGIVLEAELFAEIHPLAQILPVASTGAAAAEVFRKGRFDSELLTNLTFTTLFRRNLRSRKADT